ncbi:2Fe-2S iron-sulfur cluster-binding protein [Pajaroellobacter abortibovis]|uniref:2Fe-2S ferredoxin-type domain-containing protein n=1 Tax=Pajaroellobacter abortibovis TaxID=1882918 RepID=A0A1L6MZT7_9BACT|nr:2Fe-2S iron-sulfur cluster-binding protein [Pajaroellobacter abortibovis]APS00918.1 hypothetical protein BCY86_06015 [Pajaroellobacter abortibovis]
MPHVTIVASDVLPLAIEAPEGGRLMDLCDEHRASVPFSCRAASCGICRVSVLEGFDQLLPPSKQEQDLLDIFDALPNHRLACCIEIMPGNNAVCIQPIVEEIKL